jgi:hypothetical protein
LIPEPSIERLEIVLADKRPPSEHGLHPDQVPYLSDHAANLRRIWQMGNATNPVQAEPNQGLALAMVPSYGTSGLFDFEHRVCSSFSTLPLRRFPLNLGISRAKSP